MTPSIAAAGLKDFARGVLQSAGMRAGHAEIVAEALVYSDLRGVASHGVARLDSYLKRVRAGVMEIDPDMPLIRDAPSVGLLDASNGFGQLAGTLAMRVAIAKAGATGIGAVSVARSNHFGVAGYFAELAAKEHLVGIALTNASPAMAPFNATVSLLGTNPIAFGIPVAGRPPIILDMSSSLVARGRIRRAFMQGDPTIPAGWANDADGHPTIDPAVALKGLLAPVGGAKGAGLSLVIDILSGILSGTAPTGEVANITDISRPSNTGHLLIALDIEKFVGRDEFERQVGVVAERITAMPASDGGTVYLPGEIEAGTAARNREGGISIVPDVAEELRAIAAEYGVPLSL